MIWQCTFLPFPDSLTIRYQIPILAFNPVFSCNGAFDCRFQIGFTKSVPFRNFVAKYFSLNCFSQKLKCKQIPLISRNFLQFFSFQELFRFHFFSQVCQDFMTWYTNHIYNGFRLTSLLYVITFCKSFYL